MFCDRWQRQPENSAEYEDQNVGLYLPFEVSKKHQFTDNKKKKKKQLTNEH